MSFLLERTGDALSGLVYDNPYLSESGEGISVDGSDWFINRRASISPTAVPTSDGNTSANGLVSPHGPGILSGANGLACWGYFDTTQFLIAGNEVTPMAIERFWEMSGVCKILTDSLAIT